MALDEVDAQRTLDVVCGSTFHRAHHIGEGRASRRSVSERGSDGKIQYIVVPQQLKTI